MIRATLLSILVRAAAYGSPDIYANWHPPAPGDLRGPCPMMNTLANHGFLPRDGKNLTRPTVVSALHTALHFDPPLINTMFTQALPANPTPNATSFTLDMLNRHNILEHDASLSRADAYFGDQQPFNATVFAETTKYFFGDTIDRHMMANAKLARMLQSKASNPTYKFTNVTEAFSIGEILAPFVVFGDMEKVEVALNRTLYFFENERLPVMYGWEPPKNVTLEDILRLSKIFAKESSLTTGESSGHETRSVDMHGGMLL